jgi:hypothetical protein
MVVTPRFSVVLALDGLSRDCVPTPSWRPGASGRRRRARRGAGERVRSYRHPLRGGTLSEDDVTRDIQRWHPQGGCCGRCWPTSPLLSSTLFNKGVTLGQLGRFEEEVGVYDEVLARFGHAPRRRCASRWHTLPLRRVSPYG